MELKHIQNPYDGWQKDEATGGSRRCPNCGTLPVRQVYADGNDLNGQGAPFCRWYYPDCLTWDDDTNDYYYECAGVTDDEVFALAEEYTVGMFGPSTTEDLHRAYLEGFRQGEQRASVAEPAGGWVYRARTSTYNSGPALTPEAARGALLSIMNIEVDCPSDDSIYIERRPRFTWMSHEASGHRA